jgi:predicted oxidoreductase
MGLGGRWNTDPLRAEDVSHAQAAVEAAPAVTETAQLVQHLAQEHGLTRESIVLAWLLKHPARIQPVIGTANADRIRACADAQQVALTRGQGYALHQSARARELP